MAETVMAEGIKVLMNKLVTVVGDEIKLMTGLQDELKRLEETLEMTHALLNDAERRQVEEETANLLLRKYQDVEIEADNLVDEFNREISRKKIVIKNQINRKICMFFSCYKPLAFRWKMARKINDTNQKFKMIYEEAKTYDLRQRIANTPISVPAVFETISRGADSAIGRENEASKIVNMMLDSSDDDLSVLPIVGQGGLGKTTLAQKIFNDERIEKKFDARIWVCVAENFDTTEILKRILTSLTKASCQVESRADIVDMIREKLSGNRYLLILDDLWNEETNHWEDLRKCLMNISVSKGNFVLVTTRSYKVSSIVSTLADHSLSFLSDDDCWSVIKRRAFAGGEVPEEELQTIGKKIASKCKGLPLTANMIGATLKRKEPEYWNSILEGDFSDPNIGVLQVLKVSFDRLPFLSLKNCFSYCSIFQKDEELDRERLVQLWMAEEFIKESPLESDIESLGNRVFDTLLDGSFFQKDEIKSYDDKIYYKMHDLVHDMACSVSGGKSFNDEGRQVDLVPEVRYLAIKSLGGETAKISKDKALHLRTLISGSEIPDDMYQDLKHLRVLDMKRTYTEELSTSIGKLIHLRYLDVSHTSISALPNSICELSNLQTLRIIGCHNLIGLPDQFQQLVNLRHLVMDENTARSLQIPLGIGNLTHLRTLDFFNVGCDKGRQIEELGCLTHLKGSLAIRNLKLVPDKDDAVKVNLGEKLGIDRLLLDWSYGKEVINNEEVLEETDANNDEGVLEGLQPHKNIRSLTIEGFVGDHFPLWMMNMTVSGLSLDKLTEIRLLNCRKCQEIPTLGHLPHLKILELQGMENLKSIGPRFYYPTQYEPFRSTDTWFPALQGLILEDLVNVVEWVDMDETTTKRPLVNAFPKLEYLGMSDLPKLIKAPSHGFPSVKELYLESMNSELESTNNNLWLSKFTSLTGLNMSFTSNLSCLLDRLLQNNQCLEDLELQFCDGLTDLTFPDNEHSLQSLKSIKISLCRDLISISYPSRYVNCPSKLEIISCKNLTSLVGLCMSHVDVSDCPNLSSLSADSNLSKLEISGRVNLNSSSNWGTSLSGIKSLEIEQYLLESFDFFLLNETLRSLCLNGRDDCEHSLLDQLQHLTKLTELTISRFGIESLPEWFGNLSSLSSLSLWSCKALQYLPSKESMRHITNLSISGSSFLNKRWSQQQSGTGDSEWHKISHIPNIQFY